MLLAVDIGNSTIAIGLFDGAVLVSHWRIKTDPARQPDEYRAQLWTLLEADKIDIGRLTGAVISSVVPTLTPHFETVTARLVGRPPLLVSPELDTGLRFAYRNPLEIGPDRIVTAMAALARVEGDVVVVDLGTATTFSVVTAEGVFMGGAIAPGVGTAAEALAARAARLPRVSLTAPSRVIGTDTADNLRVGLLLGHAGLVDRVVLDMQQELGRGTAVLATGGYSSLVAPLSRTIQQVLPFLTLEGLQLIFRRHSHSNHS